MLRLLLVTVLFLPLLVPPATAVSPSSVDLLPLRKALAPLSSAGTLQTHTLIRATGAQSGLSILLREDLQITALRPGRFRAQVTEFNSESAPVRRLIVTSNGRMVWVYNPTLKAYSVSTLAEFEGADSDVPTLGLIVGGFFLGDGHSMIEGFRGITPGNSAAVLAALGGVDVSLSEHAESVGGHDDYVYQMVLAREKLTYHFYVRSETNMLSRVDVTDTSSSLHITYREDIIAALPGPAPRKSTFFFTPPLGTLKSPSVSADPF